jgi:hypothetical protein
MLTITNKPETAEEETPAKSPRDREIEYERLLEEYERLRNEVEIRIRRMRGGRVLSLQELLSRILTRKPQDTSDSK